MGFQTAYCFNDYLGFDLGLGFNLELRNIWICLSRKNIVIRVLSIATSTFNARFSTSNLQFSIFNTWFFLSNLQFFIFINAALPLWLFTGVGFFLGATPYLDLEPHWIKIGFWGHLSSNCSSWLLLTGVGFFLELRYIWIWSHTGSKLVLGDICLQFVLLDYFLLGLGFFLELRHIWI